jgi:hypothetical protein
MDGARRRIFWVAGNPNGSGREATAMSIHCARWWPERPEEASVRFAATADEGTGLPVRLARPRET